MTFARACAAVLLLAFLASCVLCAAVLHAPWGLYDIVVCIVDNQIGVLTSVAIDAVRNQPEGPTTIGRLLARHAENLTWSAEHTDDDSLTAVRVNSLLHPGDDPDSSPQWCVYLTISSDPISRIGVREVLPANEAAQKIAPILGSSFQTIDSSGYLCSLIAQSFRKSQPSQHPAPDASDPCRSTAADARAVPGH